MGDLVARAGEWHPPDRFDEYRLIRPLGRGSFGKVYLAQDEVLDRPVAIKIVTHLRDDSIRARFLIEARAIARIRHPNVLSIHRVGELDGRPFLVSEYVHGTRLDQLVGLPYEKLLDTAIGLARGLAAAHRAGVLHRDVKPENAIVDEAGLVKLLDFGLAKFDERATFQPARTGETFPVVRLPTSALDRTLSIGEVPPVDGEASESLFVTTVFHPPEVDPALPASDGDRQSSDRAEPLRGNLTGAGQVLGTPNYLAPERWAGKPASARTDVYSLGVLLYQLACGRLPFRPQSLADIARLATQSDAPPLASQSRALPEPFCQVVDRCLAREPDRRPASGDAVRELLEVLLVKPRAAAAAPHRGNPYRGLEVFEARHSELFFGRSAEVRAVVDRLRTSGAVVVAGDSGLGKSSLCRAGVIPAIERGALEDGRVWRSLTLVPGAAPVRTLATFLADHLRTGEDAIEHLLVEDPEDIGRRLRQLQARDEGLLVFVDQLEEAFTVAGDQARQSFMAVIARLSEPSPSLRLLASIRGDFVTRLGESEEFGDQAVASLFFLRPLGQSGLREAVLGPAEASGVRFESPALVDELLAETTSDSGGLPLLQFALAELWERRDRERGVITAEHVRELGGVRGALERHADGLIDRMSPPQRELARRIILSLITEHSTRARRRESELSAGDDQRAVLQMMVRGRLLVAREQDGETAYEIAHEVLLRDWGRLREWLSADAGARLVVARVERAAAEWRRLGRSRDALWGERQLSELTPAVTGALAAGEVEFVAASRRRLAGRRRRKIALWAGAALVPLLAWAAVALRDDWRRDREVKRALDDAAAVIARAHTATGEARRLRGRAFSWFDTGKWEDGEREWTAARDATAEADAALGRAALTVEEIVSRAPDRTDVRRRLTEILIERSRWADEVGELARRDELAERIRLYDPDGTVSRSLRTPAQVSFSIDPPAATLTVWRFERGEGGRTARRAVEPIATAGRVELAPGSYVLAISAPARHPAQVPLYLRAGESVEVDVRLPAASPARAGLVYVPSARFLFGAAGDEALRREYLHAAPQHETVLPAFFIADHETTYGEYVAFLDALPPAERADRRPRASSIGFHGFVELVARGGSWSLSMQPGASKLSAGWGEPIVYAERSEHAQNDWRKLPVTGVSMADAEAYAAWLDKSGTLPGARLCDEREWELAARGADGRRYPQGAALRASDANIGESHGELGPDEVGLHPASDSVVGLHDMAGNAWELTRSAVDGKPIARGGSYALDPLAASATMREQLEQAGLRDITVGFRVCASAKDD